MKQDLLYKTSYRVNTVALTGAELDVCSSWDYYFVSGGTTIISILSRWPGMQVCLEFLTETTLTHSATLQLPGDADITAAVGDVYRFAQTSNTVWKCISGGGSSGGGAISDDAYSDSWNGVTSIGASKNAIFDAMATKGFNTNIEALTGLETNIMLGDSEMHTTGLDYGNVVIGTDALKSSTYTGITNTIAIGSYVMGMPGLDTSPEGTVCIGAAAGTCDGVNRYSVCIGNFAGYGEDAEDMEGCIYIGDGAQQGDDKSTLNEIVIGYSAQGMGSSTAVIGNSDIDETYLKGITNITDTGQIAFPATVNPSDNVNTLDDYEEGTFTPQLTFGGSATGITYASQVGVYTKIGNSVHFEIEIKLTSKGSQTGDSEIIGLPFDTSSDCYRSTGFWIEQTAFTTPPTAYLRPNDDVIRIAQLTSNAAMVRLDNEDFEDISFIILTGHYTI